MVNFLRNRGHQLQELYLDGEELTDTSIDAVAGCPILRCLKVSFSGQLTDSCLLQLKVFSYLILIIFGSYHYQYCYYRTLHKDTIDRNIVC